MNRKIIYLILIIISVSVSIIFAVNGSKPDNSGVAQEKQAEVENRTIAKELTNSMEVTSGLIEKVELRISYYFKELLVEENTYIPEGENILKYTNGTYLKAPYNCILTSSSLPQESEICDGSHYVELQATDTICTNISVSEADTEYLTLGKKVELTVNALENKKYEGYITDIGQTATNSKFNVTVTFVNDGNVKLGMSGSSTIILQEVIDVLTVPVEAVEIAEDGKYVQVVEETGETTKALVETGIANANYVEIKSGLSLGQTVKYMDDVTI